MAKTTAGKDNSQKETWEQFRIDSAKYRNGILTALFTRKISIRVTYLLRNTKVTPNMVTVASFVVFTAGMPFFVFGYNNYTLLVAGVIITQISYVFDCADGELARYKKMTSPLGAWLDSVFDRLKESFVFLAMTYNVYMKTQDVRIVFIGFFAFINVIIAGYITDTKTSLNLKKTDSLANIGSKYLIGLVEIIVFGVAFAALFNRFEYLLLFFCVLGPFMWIYQITKLIMKYKSMDRQI